MFSKLFEGREEEHKVYLEIKEKVGQASYEIESRKEMAQINRLKTSNPNEFILYSNFMTNAPKEHLKRFLQTDCPDPLLLSYQCYRVNESQMSVQLMLPSVITRSVTENITTLTNEAFDCVITNMDEILVDET